MRYRSNAYLSVNNGVVINANTGTPFFAENAKSCSTPTTFLGPEGSLDALTITPSGDMGTTTVNIYSGSYHPNTETSVIQWWSINPAVSQSCDLEFRFRNAYLDNLVLEDLAVWEYNGDWVKLSENITSAVTGSAFTSITFGGVSFSESKSAHQLILADKADQTLPVELSSFNAATGYNGRITLSWATHSENGMMGFYIWRSSDAYLENAVPVSNLIDATNTSTTQSYIYVEDNSLDSGVWYYWLQAVNMDGSDHFYGSLSVTVNEVAPSTPEIPIVSGLNTLYPNPFNPNLNIAYSLKNGAVCDMSILNLRGQVIRNLQHKKLAPGSYTLHWDGKDDSGMLCGSGVYFVKMVSGKERYFKRIVFMK